MGHHHNRLPHLPDLPTLGVGLIGPGAPAAARGLLAAVISAGGPWAAVEEATVVTTAADLTRLLSTDAAHRYRSDRLHVAADLDHALAHLERHLLRRARIATDDSDSDLTTPLGDTADQPSPPLVLIITAPVGNVATRLAAILAVGSRLAITGVLLGPWPAGATWHVNSDGTVRSDGRADTTGTWLNVLDVIATTDILGTLQQARPDPDPPPHQGPRSEPTTVSPAEPRPGAVPPTARLDTTPALASTEQPEPTAPRPTTAHLQLTVLGKPTLHLVDGDTRTTLRVLRRVRGLAAPRRAAGWQATSRRRPSAPEA